EQASASSTVPVPSTPDPAKPAQEPAAAPEVQKPSPAGAELPGDKGTNGNQASSADEPATAVPPPPGKAAAEPARDTARSSSDREVQFVTDPAGATITVDGNSALSCSTPCLLSLSLGRHTLNTQIDGYRPYPRIFNVPQDSDVFLKLSKSVGTLNITSSPTGASIIINGEPKPQKTPATFVLAPGEYSIRVVHAGVPLDFTVQVREGEFYTRNVSFQ
ncbi:MAG: PEGA domain-containing protein, partial [Acidobacteriaceae bacterium]|nr:PEGA domain-containing protein [Acidobacteriaceae bacterium]